MTWSPEGPESDRDYNPPASKPLCTTRPSSVNGDWDKVVQYLEARGLNPEVAKSNGWYASRTAGDEELRVVIPCLSEDLTNRYWQARLLRDTEGKFPLRYTSPHHVRRGDALAVVFTGSCDERGTVLVEGPMDALAAASIGYIGIAWMGTTPGDEPITFAHRLVVPPVYVVCDTDAVTAAVRIWQNFIGSYLVNPYPFKDLAKMPEKERYGLLSNGR